MSSRLVLLAALTFGHQFCRAEYRFSDDFSSCDSASRPYGVWIDETTHYSHGHGMVVGGRYALLLHGNRHWLTTPRLSNFKLEMRVSLVSELPNRHPVGLRIFFRDEDEICVRREVGGRLKLFHGEDVLAEREVVEYLDLTDAVISLEAENDEVVFNGLGFSVRFKVRCGAGKIGFDSIKSVAQTVWIDDVSVASSETPELTESVKRKIILPTVQGFEEPLVYDLMIGKYEKGPSVIRCALSGGVASMGPRVETGGHEWESAIERLTTPYVRAEWGDGTSRTFNLWLGMREFTMRNAPCQWPLVREFAIPGDPPEPVLLAAGYENAIATPWRFAANGPYERIVTQDGESVHLGSALTGGRVALAMTSPSDKIIVSKIPKEIPHYESALRHARDEHYFMQGEQVSFVLSTTYRESEWAAEDIKTDVSLLDVYGETVSGVSIEETGVERRRIADGLCRTVRDLRLDRNPGVGVWKIRVEMSRGPLTPEREDIVFEVLPEDPSGPCPPQASGLPVLVSMPSEQKYLERSAFDPQGSFGGLGHYFAVDFRYPKVGNALECWRLDSVYARKWWCNNCSRNSDNVETFSDFGQELVRHAGYYGDSRDREFDGQIGYPKQYCKKDFLYALREFLCESGLKLKYVTTESVDRHITEKSRLTPDEFKELFSCCWRDFLSYFNRRLEENVRSFNDRLFDLNPQVGKAGYGPYPFYFSHGKTAYALTYSGLPVEHDDRVRRNGSFWLFEEYHNSCDYPLWRGAFFVAGYDCFYGYGRRIFPEIYYSAWNRCLDSAVYCAHPLSAYQISPNHQRRIVYRYVYGTPHFRDGAHGFWRDYGFHARNPERESMEAFVDAWGKCIKNRPEKPLKSPFLALDFKALSRHGEILDGADVVNTGEEDLAYAYDRCVESGRLPPVVCDFSALDHIASESADFIILPPIVSGTDQQVLRKIRSLHARGVNLLGFEQVCGLEDLFDDSGYKKTRYGRTVLVKDPPSFVKRCRFEGAIHAGQEGVCPETRKKFSEILDFLNPAPIVKAEGALALSAETENGDVVIVLEDNPPLYGDVRSFPQVVTVKIAYPGIGERHIECDSKFSVSEVAYDSLVLRVCVDRDSASFLRILRTKHKHNKKE